MSRHRFRELAADFEAIAVDAVQARHGVAAAIDSARQVVEARAARVGTP